MATILDRLEKDPEPWKPDPGDTLVGKVLEIEERVTEYGPYPCVTVEQADGTEVLFHAFHTVAKNELAKKAPRPGDEIGIKYLGRDNELKYERYRVIVEHAEPVASVEPDWSAMAVESGAELADAAVATRAPQLPDDDAPF